MILSFCLSAPKIRCILICFFLVVWLVPVCPIRYFWWKNGRTASFFLFPFSRKNKREKEVPKRKEGFFEQFYQKHMTSYHTKTEKETDMQYREWEADSLLPYSQFSTKECTHSHWMNEERQIELYRTEVVYGTFRCADSADSVES